MKSNKKEKKVENSFDIIALATESYTFYCF